MNEKQIVILVLLSAAFIGCMILAAVLDNGEPFLRYRSRVYQRRYNQK